MPKKPWTTPDERAWLRQQIPRWLKRQEKKYKGVMGKIAFEFLRTFPNSRVDPSKALTVSMAFVFTPRLISY